MAKAKGKTEGQPAAGLGPGPVSSPVQQSSGTAVPRPSQGGAGYGEPVPQRMSYEEFLQWADEDTLAEWVDGRVVTYSPASDRHQDLVRFLTSVLSIYVESRGLGAIRSGPFQMKLEQTGREPDVIFVASEHQDRVQKTYLDGPADLAVEIASPESAARDRGEKYYEYEAGGVREYWLVDPERRHAEFYQLGGDGRYHSVQPDDDGRYHSQVLEGFWLRVDWLWQDRLPSAIRAVGEIAGVDPSVIADFENRLRRS